MTVDVHFIIQDVQLHEITATETYKRLTCGGKSKKAGSFYRER